MEFKNISVNLKNSSLLQLPLNQNQRQLLIDPNQFENSDVTLICYKIHLIQENEDVFVYLFKNINPTSIWYDMKIRDGDRLITLNGQDVTRLSYENIYSSMIEKKISFTCQLIWHPELYIEFGTTNIKNINPEQDCSILSQTLIGMNIYEKLTQILRYLLDYHPKEPHQLFDELSKKQELLPINNQTDYFVLAQQQLTILSNHSTIEGNPEETMGNILELNDLFEQIGIGLNKDEIYWIWLSMKSLLNEKIHIQKLRFWGKIFGIKNNYYIAEADFDTFDDIDLNDSEFIKYQETYSAEEENEIDNNIINMNRKVPPEPIGNGVNQKIFYVSTGIDQPFVQLPMVTPEQIVLSRKIQQFFTGDLEAAVRFKSDFPGVEKHLLRAQIQRISAGTQIGPKNYFKIPVTEEEQMGEETMDQRQINFDVNSEFQGNALEDLASSNGQYWVHCAPYIYKQGRNEKFPQEDEERSAIRKISVEHSPYSLSPISKDTTINELYPAWSAGIASTLMPEHALIYVRSNRWPGAFTVGNRDRFKNIYIGWGVKTFIENHQANMIDKLPENEYGLQIIEIDDPTIEEENDLFKSSILLSPDEDEEFDID